MKNNLVGFFIISIMALPVLAEVTAPSKVFVAVSQVIARSQEHSALLAQAHDEASAFSFSDGALRGRVFSKALALVRSENPRLSASDMDIAIAILQAN